MPSKTAKQLREVYGRAIDWTVGRLHRDIKVDASDLSQLLDMAEEAEEVRSVKAENERLRAEVTESTRLKNAVLSDFGLKPNR